MSVRVRDTLQGATIELKVQAGSKKTEIIGCWNDALRMRVAKKPEDGAANKAIIEFFSQWFNVSRQAISIIKGEFFQTKVIRIAGMTSQQVQTLVQESLLNK